MVNVLSVTDGEVRNEVKTRTAPHTRSVTVIIYTFVGNVKVMYVDNLRNFVYTIR